jgi:DNA helicase II / ATP-dependent DNA helicase PcrA
VESPLDELNPDQERAVLFEGFALMVAAGPGSGKTRVVTRRIAHRIRERRVPPDRILAVTFTNRAAREMSDRVQGMILSDARIPIGTFHWMCAGILRRHIGLLGYRSDFRLLQPKEARQVLQTVLPAGQGNAGGLLSTAIEAVSGLKSGVPIESLAEQNAIPIERLRGVANDYQRALRRLNTLDLDDLPYLAAKVLRENPHVRDLCREMIDELLVDEYQDTNLVQQELVEWLAPVHGTVVVVGDEDQAIYGWRHADAGGFRRFLEAFTSAEVIKLERSYRHSKYVARAANALIMRSEDRLEKTIQSQLPAGSPPVCFVAADEHDEAQWICSEIARLAASEGVRWNDIAILYRVNAQSRAVEDALVRCNIPYRVLSGRSFYAREHIQTVYAYLRLALNRDDDTSAEILIRSVPGIGPGRIAELHQRANAQVMSLTDTLASVHEMPRFPRNVRLALEATHRRISTVESLRKCSLMQVVDAAVEAAQAEMEAAGMLTESVREDFTEVQAMARLHQARRGTLRSLVDAMTFDDSTHESDGGVNVMSLHSAKGLEYRAVFVSGVEEGLLPHARSLQRPGDVEEERRLCYVGMTRAKELLYLSYAQARLFGGRGTTGQPSRFIQEIGLHNMVLKVTSANRIKPRLATTRAGDRVRHTRWGTGTVEVVEGTGRETLTTILFDTGGRRRLQLCHAPLSFDGENPTYVPTG